VKEVLVSDQVFIRKLTEIVHANLGNENFGVKELVDASGISLYRLSRKLHSINKKTINQFIREVRLQKAREMLQNEAFSVSEVAYKSGFSSPAYFNTCFHEFFGYPPGKVKKNSLESYEEKVLTQVIEKPVHNKPLFRTLMISLSGILFLVVLILIVAYIVYPKIFKRDILEKLRSSGEKVSVAVMPFQNMTNDTTLNIWRDAIQQSLISSLSNTGELRVRQKDNINTLLQTKGLADHATISPAIAVTISKKLNSDIFIYGSIQSAGSAIRVDAQLIDTKTKVVFKSFKIERPSGEGNFFQIIDTLSGQLRNFLMISEIIKKNPRMQNYMYDFRSPEVLRYVIYGDNAKGGGDYSTARNWYYKALAIDSNSFDAILGLWQTASTMEERLQFLLNLHKKRDHMPVLDQLFTNWAYAISFGSPGEVIKCLRQIQLLDEQNPNIPLLMGNAYREMNQYDKVIPLYKKEIEMFHKWEIKDNLGYAALGEIYHKTGQYKKEKKLYKKAERNNPDHSTISFSWIIRDQATLSLAKGDTVAANRYIKKFISVLKGNSYSEADIADGLALMYRLAGMPGKAEEYYRKALSLEAENPQRMNILSTFFCESKRHLDEIPGLIDRALALATDKYDYYEYLDTKGWGLYKQGNLYESLELFQRIWDSAPFPMYSYKSHLEEVKKAIAEQK